MYTLRESTRRVRALRVCPSLWHSGVQLCCVRIDLCVLCVCIDDCVVWAAEFYAKCGMVLSDSYTK